MELLGVAEIAGRLGVSRQRVHQIRQRGGFPAPVAQLASGDVWDAADIDAWIATWVRRPGRPAREVSTS